MLADQLIRQAERYDQGVTNCLYITTLHVVVHACLGVPLVNPGSLSCWQDSNWHSLKCFDHPRTFHQETRTSCSAPSIGSLPSKYLFNDLAKIIQCLSNTQFPVTSLHRPGPRPPSFSYREHFAAPSVVPWYEQKRHIPYVDYAMQTSRIQAARLANQHQYYMSP
ncbi:hypothetical protein Bpfe_018294 [Biomphalaria pfeifferi]|uniref:Uncharacterized protein n=1 Tax=Biomphalaria pfeifferi TaxID=112525 RepID=A0AAD8BD14_BIOPF|nr:hypothetical protein Bpfe_018294 [Biomphalaria pfeifferi]